MRLFLVPLFLAFASAAALAQPDRSSDEIVRNELKRIDLEQAAVAQSGDAVAMSAMLHPNYVAHVANGRLVDRAQTLAFVATGELARERFERVQESVIISGDTAVVMGLDKMAAPPPLATRGERSRRYSNIYARHDGRWKLLARHFHFMP